jgi:hypothetical protein
MRTAIACLTVPYVVIHSMLWFASERGCFSSLQTLAAILQAEPENPDSRNAGQPWAIEDPAVRGIARVFKAK